MPLKEITSKYFFGRKSELELLQNIALQAKAGDADSVILLGNRGIGKTELLKHFYNELFNSRDNAIPFFYTIKTAFSSVERFAGDYLYNYILQCLAFMKKDLSLIHSGIYSLEDLKSIADKSGVIWVSNVLEHYSQIKGEGDLLKLFSYVISVPSQSHRYTGMPVVVMIDDFHKIKKLSGLDFSGYSDEFWMLFENSIRSRYTPHILAGLQSELNMMFFEKSSLGEQLEIMNLKSLSGHDTAELFSALCEKYALSYEANIKDFFVLFGGNPFYINCYLQAARQGVTAFTEDVFWEIYIREITRGKIYIYWTSILKSYVRRFELRKSALHLLFNLSLNGTDDLSSFANRLSVKQEDIDNIIALLHTAGILETGFSALEFVDDRILTDLIKGLYHKEIDRESPDKIKEAICGGKRRHIQRTDKPTFEIVIPAVPKAELVVVKSLEQVGEYFDLPYNIIGQLQIALAELFNTVLVKREIADESYQLKFDLNDKVLSIEVLTSQTDLDLSIEHTRQLRQFVDDIRLEELVNGSRITLIKQLKDNIPDAQN